jgi:hypothetical protein
MPGSILSTRSAVIRHLYYSDALVRGLAVDRGIAELTNGCNPRAGQKLFELFVISGVGRDAIADHANGSRPGAVNSVGK